MRESPRYGSNVCEGSGGAHPLVTLLFVLFLYISTIVFVSGCGGPSPEPVDRGSEQGKVEAGPLPERLNRLAFKLLKQVTEEGAAGNVFLSPASLEMAIAMTMNGAGSDTLSSMQKALELEGLSQDELNKANKSLMGWLQRLDPKVALEIANSLWARNGITFNPSFLRKNRSFFGAQIDNLDFDSPSAAGIINRWVSENTKGKIKEMVTPPIDTRTVIFLLNAIYFKGKWTTQFDESKTREQDFTVGGGTSKKVPMMKQSGEFKYFENEAFQAIFLPYGGGKAGMYVFLPREANGLPGFIKAATAENWKQWTSRLSKAEGDISMPRFKLEYEKTLNETLSALGMGVAFTEKADFENMLTPDAKYKAFIQQVKQKTYADVNEEGTEAAAVTSVQGGITAVAPGERFSMVVDHPFFFSISDNGGKVILFEGAVLNP